MQTFQIPEILQGKKIVSNFLIFIVFLISTIRLMTCFFLTNTKFENI